ALAESGLASKGVDRAAYEPVFDAAVDVNAKAFVVLFVPACALLVWLMSLRSPRPGAVHWVFTLHFVAFVLIALGVLVPVVGWALSMLLYAFGGSDRQIDRPFSWVLVALVALYAFKAFGRVYREPLPWRAVKAVVLPFVLFFLLIRAYRFV